ALAGAGLDALPYQDRVRASLLLDVALDGIGRALADVAAVEVDAAHPGLRGEGDEVRPERVHVALAEAVLLLREHDDAAPLRSLVGERRELRGVGEPFHRSAVTGETGRRLLIAERDR